MYKLLIIMMLTMAIFVFSCGKSTHLALAPDITKIRINGLISHIHISNNQIDLTTTQKAYYRFEYYNTLNNVDRYYGFSTTNTQKYNNLCSIPTQFFNSNYKIKLTAFGETGYQDTTFYFQSGTENINFLKVTFIDVAQGDAILIQTPEGKNIQIDGGYGTMSNSSEPYFGGGVPLALNYLKNNNITDLNYIVETHHHKDHYGGLRDIQNDGSITIHNSISSNSYYPIGSFIDNQSQATFQVMNLGYPPEYTGNSLNNTSLVIKMVYGETEYLFTGDAEGAVQDYMMSNPWSLSSDLLKIAHHGASSEGTSSMSFLQNVLNQYNKIGILTFGTNNPYQHPRDLSRFRNFYIYGTEVPSYSFNTDNFHFNQGNIITYTDGQAIVITNKKNN